MRRSLSVLAAVAALAAAAPASAQQNVLERFEGRFTGGGTLERRGSTTNLTCDLTGNASGDNLTLSGRCRANIFAGANIRITVRGQGNRFTGTFTDGLGTVSTLSGTGSGSALSLLATETAESVRPDPPARMNLTRSANGLSLTVRNTEAGKGSNIALNLRAQ